MMFSKAAFTLLTIAASAKGQTLGTAAAYGVLAGTTITNTGLTVINAQIGVSPGTAITGFPPGLNNGADSANAAALQAKADAELTYAALVALPSTAALTGTDLGGQTLTPGVYTFTSSGGLTGTVVLDAQNDANAVFVFQFGSTITTASNSAVRLINGAQACNVFWQIGSSATFGTGTTFLGNVVARTSITVTTGTTLNRGGFYALDGAVTLDTNNIDQGGACGNAPAPDPTTSTTSSAPVITLPSVTLPSVILPTITLPSLTLPSITLPSVTLPSITLPSVTLPSITLPTIILPTTVTTSITDVPTTTTTSTVTNPASTTTVTVSVPVTITQTVTASPIQTTSTTTKWSTKPCTKTASATKCPTTKATTTKKATKTTQAAAAHYKRARQTKTKTVVTTCAGHTKTVGGSTKTVKSTHKATSVVWQTKTATTSSTSTYYPACTNSPKMKRDYERMFE
jgi:hypothetical protein